MEHMAKILPFICVKVKNKFKKKNDFRELFS